MSRSKIPLTHAVLHAEVEVVLGLEGVIECDDKRMIRRRKDLLLRQCTLDLFPLYHLLLGQDYVLRSDQSMHGVSGTAHLSSRTVFPSSSPAQGTPSQHRPFPAF